MIALTPEILRAARLGFVGGLLWSAPFAVLTFIVCLNERISPVMSAIAAQGTLLIWASIAMVVRVGQTVDDAAPRSEIETDWRETIRESVGRAARQATLIATPVAAFLVFGTWGYGASSAVMSGAMLMGIWVGSAALVGLGRGEKLARERLFAKAPLGWEAHHRKLVAQSARRAARQSCWSAVPVSLAIGLFMVAQGTNVIMAVIVSASVIATWVGSAAGVGANRGEQAARTELAARLKDTV
jgi:hypothetical protein